MHVLMQNVFGSSFSPSLLQIHHRHHSRPLAELPPLPPCEAPPLVWPPSASPLPQNGTPAARPSFPATPPAASRPARRRRARPGQPRTPPGSARPGWRGRQRQGLITPGTAPSRHPRISAAARHRRWPVAAGGSGLWAARRSAPHVAPLHAVLLKLGLSASAILATSLAHLALQCGLPRYARDLFDEMPRPDVVSWTSLVTGHAHQGLYRDSLALLRRMVGSGVMPNGYSLSGGLFAFAGVGQGALALGKEIHASVVKMRKHGPVDAVVENGVLDMYARCGSIEYARRVFGFMLLRNIVAFNTMMAALLGSGQAEEALRLFVSMVSSVVGVDGFSFSIIVDACGELALLKQGMQVHARVIGGGFEADAVVRNSLLDMHAKCGCVDSAELVFKAVPSRDAVLWTTMISAYGKFGHVQDAVSMFDKMAHVGIKQDCVAYLAVLSACSHAVDLPEKVGTTSI